MLFRKNVIEKNFMSWRVFLLIKINTRISDTPCTSRKSHFKILNEKDFTIELFRNERF
jgi:hypothetical protein